MTYDSCEHGAHPALQVGDDAFPPLSACLSARAWCYAEPRDQRAFKETLPRPQDIVHYTIIVYAVLVEKQFSEALCTSRCKIWIECWVVLLLTRLCRTASAQWNSFAPRFRTMATSSLSTPALPCMTRRVRVSGGDFVDLPRPVKNFHRHTRHGFEVVWS